MSFKSVNKKKKIIQHSESFVPNLSGISPKPLDKEYIKQKIEESLNNEELQKSLDKWLKENENRHKIVLRDLNLLKSIITEYLEGFLLIGYNLEGERVILQNYSSPKDRDALMEFLKNVFIQQQSNNLLDN
jgi:hypothetical protein